jgi:iron complex outermembrane recepter protein
MRVSALILLFLISYNCVKAQQVNGLAQDTQGKPLAKASVALKNNKDSSVVKLSISDTTGQYEFSPVAPGRYFVTVSHIGYISRSSESFEIPREGRLSLP